MREPQQVGILSSRMSKMTSEEIDHLAKLSRLNLSVEERQKLPEELSKITAFVEALKQADLGGTESQSSESVVLAELRSDEPVSDQLSVEQLSKAAPVWKENYLVVPPVFTENNDV